MDVKRLKAEGVLVNAEIDNDLYQLKRVDGGYGFFINNTKFYQSKEYFEARKILTEFLIKNNEIDALKKLKIKSFVY